MPLPIAFERSVVLEPPCVGCEADQQRVVEVAEEFESILLGLLVRQMRLAGAGEGLFGEEDQAGEIYWEMMDMVFGQHLARSKALGLSEMIARQLAQKALEEAGGVFSD